jgi:hypothetical protein
VLRDGAGLRRLDHVVKMWRCSPEKGLFEVSTGATQCEQS